MGHKIFPYTHMRGDQARPRQTRQRFIYPLKLILFSLSSSAYCLQLMVFSLLSSTHYLQLTVFNLLCPRCSRQVWGGVVDFITRLSLISEVDNLVMSVTFYFIMD